MSKIMAKVSVHSVSENLSTPGDASTKYSENVTMGAVYSSDPQSENYSFSKSTPNMSVSMTIENPGAFGAFIPGKEYLVEFTPVNPPVAVDEAPKAA